MRPNDKELEQRLRKAHEELPVTPFHTLWNRAQLGVEQKSLRRWPAIIALAAPVSAAAVAVLIVVFQLTGKPTEPSATVGAALLAEAASPKLQPWQRALDSLEELETGFLWQESTEPTIDKTDENAEPITVSSLFYESDGTEIGGPTEFLLELDLSAAFHEERELL